MSHACVSDSPAVNRNHAALVLPETWDVNDTSPLAAVDLSSLAFVFRAQHQQPFGDQSAYCDRDMPWLWQVLQQRKSIEINFILKKLYKSKIPTYCAY